MMRIAHKITSNKANQRPSRMLFVDVESHLVPVDHIRTEHRLRLGWCCYWRRRSSTLDDTIIYERFTTIPQFWTIVDRLRHKREPLYLVAHNVNYDFGVLRIFDNLRLLGFELSNIYLSGTTAMATFKDDPYKIIMLDNSNYFSTSLANLGDSIGLAKLDTDPLNASDKELDIYCHRDVEIMVKAWQDYFMFLDTHNLGNWAKTLPGQAFNAYRHRFMHNDIYIHTNNKVTELERAAYHGGRTTAFYQGELNNAPLYKVDVNSMYPFVMLAKPYPTRLKSEYRFMSLVELEQLLPEHRVIARVTLNTNQAVYPVKVKNHLVHPVGRFETVLCSPELSYALNHSHIENIKDCSVYHQGMIFSNYVRFFYDLKVEYTSNDKIAYRTMAKLYLNSLYGKFGQLDHNWFVVDDPNLISTGADFYVDTETGKQFTIYPFDNRAWLCSVEGESFNSFPAIAAHVTAEARMYLWQLMSVAGEGNYYYADTDSLIVNQVGLDNLQDYMHDTRLGALKIEDKAQTVKIMAPKTYAMDHSWKRKGIPKGATYLGNDTWRMDLFPSFRTQCRWAHGTRFHTTKSNRHLTYVIHDGEPGYDGWVQPVQASDLFPDFDLTDDDWLAIHQFTVQIDQLKANRPVDNAIVFKYWDYRKGTFKKARTSNGELVPIEYSNADSVADELGFDDLAHFKEAVRTTVRINRTVASLEKARRNIRTPHSSESSQEPIPF